MKRRKQIQQLPLTQPNIVRRKRRKVYPTSRILIVIATIVILTIIVVRFVKARPTGLFFYTPSDEISTEKWDWPFIHIINTRFMQEQHNLTALAWARFKLFEAFCLPTMQQQTSQHFLWIIKVDPNLDESLLKAMIEAVDGAPNFYIVGSNQNFGTHPKYKGSWRDGAEPLDLMQSKIYSGDQALLETAMRMRTRVPVLETRLDADDGLALDLVEDVQEQATEDFKDEKLQWKYWCAKRSIEWHWAPKAVGTDSEALLQGKEGVILPIGHSKLCVTPGITVGYPLGTTALDVPIFSHTDIVKDITEEGSKYSCGLEQSSDCLSFFEKQRFAAIRSRTPTSTGMLDVVARDSIALDYSKHHSNFCGLVNEDFGISRQILGDMNNYITTNIVAIAEENLAGQCKTGHSCKVGTKPVQNFFVNSSSRPDSHISQDTAKKALQQLIVDANATRQ